jgi:hypothetical protein
MMTAAEFEVRLRRWRAEFESRACEQFADRGWLAFAQKWRLSVSIGSTSFRVWLSDSSLSSHSWIGGAAQVHQLELAFGRALGPIAAPDQRPRVIRRAQAELEVGRRRPEGDSKP